jgi:hypothetical protein
MKGTTLISVTKIICKAVLWIYFLLLPSKNLNIKIYKILNYLLQHMGMNIGLLLWEVIFLWFILWCTQYLDNFLLSGRMIGK